MSVLDAALAYAEAGLFVGPLKARTKHPGSVLGDSWEIQTSRDPEVITKWFTGTTHGVFLHAGRSGLVILDVDNPEELHADVARAIVQAAPPYQTSRKDEPDRGHYLFRVPDGRDLGNSLGGLGEGWGQVRGRNGVIVAAPSVHQARGGLYTWQRTGTVPVLPDYLADALPDAMAADAAVNDAEVGQFIAEHDEGDRHDLLLVHVEGFNRAVRGGAGRHDTMTGRLTGAMKDARSGLFPAETAIDSLEDAFIDAIGDERDAGNEYQRMVRWSVAQALATEPEDHRAYLHQRGMLAPDVSEVFEGAAEPDLGKLADRHQGQARMAYQLAIAEAGYLLHVHEVGWFVWDRTRWVEDSRGVATRAVLKVLRRALAESWGDKELQASVRACESAGGVRGVLKLAGSLEPFAATVGDLDADPYLLNVANGTLDLRTMDLRPHDPADRITKVTAAAYRTDVPGGRWETFLEQVLPDAEVRAFLARYVGQALVGRPLEHALAILTGTGRNGKGVFYGAVAHALGDYAITAEPDLFMHREGAHPTGQMDLRGARWAVVSESDRGRRLAEATVKKLTGGDKIKARRMRKNFVEFDPSHSAALVTNHLPKVSGDDPALWARLRVVPFDIVIPPADRDTHLPETLMLEAEAVLAWAIAGYRNYYVLGGLAEPAAVLAATADYQTQSDVISRFLDDECEIDPAATAPFGDLHTRWEQWRTQERDAGPALSGKALAQELGNRGFAAGRSGSARIRRGLRLKAVDPDDESQAAMTDMTSNM